jgi:hypothetical protein
MELVFTGNALVEMDGYLERAASLYEVNLTQQFNEGFDKGREMGHNEGFDEGREMGHNEGYDEATVELVNDPARYFALLRNISTRRAFVQSLLYVIAMILGAHVVGNQLPEAASVFMTSVGYFTVQWIAIIFVVVHSLWMVCCMDVFRWRLRFNTRMKAVCVLILALHFIPTPVPNIARSHEYMMMMFQVIVGLRAKGQTLFSPAITLLEQTETVFLYEARHLKHAQWLTDCRHNLCEPRFADPSECVGELARLNAAINPPIDFPGTFCVDRRVRAKWCAECDRIEEALSQPQVNTVLDVAAQAHADLVAFMAVMKPIIRDTVPPAFEVAVQGREFPIRYRDFFPVSGDPISDNPQDLMILWNTYQADKGAMVWNEIKEEAASGPWRWFAAGPWKRFRRGVELTAGYCADQAHYWSIPLAYPVFNGIKSWAHAQEAAAWARESTRIVADAPNATWLPYEGSIYKRGAHRTHRFVHLEKRAAANGTTAPPVCEHPTAAPTIVVENATIVVEENATVVENATKNATIVVENATVVVEENATVIKNATIVVENATVVVEENATVEEPPPFVKISLKSLRQMAEESVKQERGEAEKKVAEDVAPQSTDSISAAVRVGLAAVVVAVVTSVVRANAGMPPVDFPLLQPSHAFVAPPVRTEFILFRIGRMTFGQFLWWMFG